MSRLDHACGNGRATLAERGHDLYETPAVAVESLLREFRVRPDWRIWEPACGPGAIVRVLRAAGHEVVSSDLVDYNPPFKLAAEFVEHALELCPRVVMLLRLAFLESDRRSNILDNGLLSQVLVYRKRLPMMHRAEWAGRKANSGMAFAWFVWDRWHRGETTIRRISWDRPSRQPPREAAGGGT